MKTPFFITGLPRSRTAWLANLFTTDTTICYHDRPFESKLCNREDKKVGFSCSEIIWSYQSIHYEFPTARWLVVVRDGDDSLRSFKRFASKNKMDTEERSDLTDNWKGRCQFISEILREPCVFGIHYEELENEWAVRRAWELLVEAEFDSERFHLLQELRVEQHFDKALANRKELLSWQ